MQTAAVLVIGRTLHRVSYGRDGKFARGEYGGTARPRRVEVKDVDQANLVSSLTVNNTHAPALDIDFPVHVVPSSTPGHYHLYLEKELSWVDYHKLLTTLYEVGIIEKEWFDMSMSFMQTYLRLPHIHKEPPSSPSYRHGYDDGY